MKTFISLLLGMALVVGTATATLAQDKKEGDRKEQKTKKGENKEWSRAVETGQR